MMGDRKYIVITVHEDTHVLVFDWFLRHDDMWKGARRSLRHIGQLSGAEVRSAGFIDYRGRPYGRSESLNIDGHEDDEMVLREFLGGGYVLDSE